MNIEKPFINIALAQHLITTQFPQWKDLPIQSIEPGGWDNKSFRLGKEMLIRMPSATAYAAQVEKEHQWLPKLAPFLPLEIPTPLAMGEPTNNYPWKWSIYRWIEGEIARSAHITNLSEFATQLAQFLIALQSIDPTNGPLPGPHNFYRGGSLTTYDAEVRKAIAVLKNKIDADIATEIWETALETTWHDSPIWIHGDLSADNLLVKNGQLNAVIDFGQLGIGDPACDLTIAWTFFKDESRKIFYSMLSLDAATWVRGRAWALWKALIVAAGFTNPNNTEAKKCWHIIDEVLADHKNKL